MQRAKIRPTTPRSFTRWPPKCSLPRCMSLGARNESFIKARRLRSRKKARSLNAPTSSSSRRRPLRRMLSRNAFWKRSVRRRASGTTPRSKAICRRASITPAQSTDFGQRAVHVMHDTHFQIDSARMAFSIWPSCTRRISRFGKTSMASAIGQPAEHLPH